MRRVACVMLTAILGLSATARVAVGQPPAQPVAVEPSELRRRADLVGKQVALDDRVRFYHLHPDRDYDDLHLKRTDIVVRLRPPFRPQATPRALPVVVQGRLIREENQLVFEATSLKVQPGDLERVDRAVAALLTKDFEGRKSWAAWAEKRGKDFGDGALLQRAGGLRAEALRVEADQRRGTVDAPREWLALAEDARRRGITEPEPSALAHRAFQARLASTTQLKALQDLKAAIERFFPAAAGDRGSGLLNLARWVEPYRNDPAAAYRAAPADLRKGLDRRLWADVAQKVMEAQAAADPIAGIALDSQAENEIPERKELASRLLNLGLEAAQRNLGSLRKDEVRSMGEAYRTKLKNPQAAIQLYRGWLKVQRDRLSDTDAEGPIDLAAVCEELLQDRAAAKDLLERAWKIAPGSKEVAEAFRTRGFQLVKDHWEEATPGAAGGESASTGSAENTSPAPLSAGGLRGKTQEEVVRQIGSKPDRKVFSGTKGQVVEQWIFHVPTQNKDRYVNFLRSPGEIQPRVVSDFTLPGAFGKSKK